MKARNGYVSNSSSSSFIIVGRKINNPLQAIRQGKKVLVYVECGGTSGEAEDWAMYLDEETYDILIRSRWFNERKAEFWESNDNISVDYDPEGGDDIMTVNAESEGTLFAFNRDYSSPNSKEGLLKFLERG